MLVAFLRALEDVLRVWLESRQSIREWTKLERDFVESTGAYIPHQRETAQA